MLILRKIYIKRTMEKEIRDPVTKEIIVGSIVVYSSGSRFPGHVSIAAIIAAPGPI